MNVTRDSSSGKSLERADMYIEHWKMKLSSTEMSALSKTSGTRGLMALLDFGASDKDVSLPIRSSSECTKDV